MIDKIYFFISGQFNKRMLYINSLIDMFKRFPHFKQNNVSDCGPTCLRIIAKFYNLNFSSEILRRFCYISREGVNLLAIKKTAELIGFKAVGMKLTFKQLVEKNNFPCILYWNQNHFVVCYDITKKAPNKYKIKISDPASQRITYTKEEFLHCWGEKKSDEYSCGVALFLKPKENYKSIKDEFNKESHSLLSYLKYFSPYRMMIGQLFLAIVVGSLLQIVPPFLSQAMIDQGINTKSLNVISLILLAQLFFFMATLSIDYVRSWILLHINSRIDIALIADFLIKLTSMPIQFFDSRMTSDILQRIGDHGRIKNFLLGNSITILFSMVNFSLFLGILAYYNILIFCIFIVGNSLYLIWISFFMKYRRELDIKRFNQSVVEQSKMIQLVQGMQDIKLNNCECQKRWEWERVQVKLFSIGLKGLKIGQFQQTGVVLFTQTTNILIYYIAAKAVVTGSMTLGMMMSLVYIIGQLSTPVNELIGFTQSFQDAKISLERLNEVNSQDDEETGIEKKKTEISSDIGITVNNISFSYNGSPSDFVLKNISIKIPANKVTAIVGESGCGKTTLIKLLQGFYAPTCGSINVGGTTLMDINPHSWRAATGSVLQDSYIFSDTIAGNIAINKEIADSKRMKIAAHLACIDSFINSLPLGYETIIGKDGKGISQGQRQRILLARAIYKDPIYMFLDEATNSLDATTEAQIMHNLRKFYKGRTVVVSAHRLSTIKDADNIIVMCKGKVVEQGSHSELLNEKKYYYRLIKNQVSLL